MMNQNLIFVPVLMQVLLVFMLYIQLGVKKAQAVKSGNVNRKKAALDTNEWPEYVIKISNNIGNQFETPIIFYVLSIVVYLLSSVNIAVLTLSWIYVISRYAHAYIHTHSNYVPHRLRAFLVGVLILICITLHLLNQILFSA